MQLLVLKLNTDVGAALQRAAGLQRANAQLRIEAATGSGEGRIEPLAAATGMTFAPSGSVHFVASDPAADVARAASVLSQPIQPHESTSATPEAGGTGGESKASEATSTGTGEANTTSEATAASGKSSPAGSGETGAPAESHSAEVTSASTGEPEASAATAGGVAAGR
jgi:hypothetical protein